MVWWISALATPGIVFLSTGTLAGHQIRPCAAQSGIFDGLVHVEHDLMLCGFTHGEVMMPDHELPMVPFEPGFALFIHVFDLLAMSDVACFHRTNS